MFEDQKQFLKTLSGKTRDQNDTFLFKITNWVNNLYIIPIYFYIPNPFWIRGDIALNFQN